MSHHRYQSTGSYTPVLIRPSRSSDAALLRPPGPPPRLKYPYPIPIISLLDLSYTIHASRNRRVASHFLPLAIGRTLILLLAIGSSTRWRVRGGWVAVCSAVTVLGTVWEVCKDRLDPAASDGVEASDTAFLIMTATMAILQYLVFVLLLRLSPPSHRLNPLSLRLPRSAIQTPTAFQYSTDVDDGTSGRETQGSGDEDDEEEILADNEPVSPTRRYHTRFPSQATVRTIPQSLPSDPEGDDGEGLMEEEEEEEEESDASSISESSIIDLPPAQSPARIIPPTSFSVTAKLDSMLNDDSPVLGPLVRRTRSARLLARSWGRESSSGEGSYGTFGFRRDSVPGGSRE